jgi:phosphopantothenoylcysteine decarboxylase / phosphopantothenate---cysteine ligase
VAKSSQRPKCVVGFAAETSSLIENAEFKLQDKTLDAIIANLVGAGVGFGDVLHEAALIRADCEPVHFPKTSKLIPAQNILELLAPMV